MQTIQEKYLSLGGAAFLGQPQGEEAVAPDGIGRYIHYARGSIYWTPETGACAVFGAIREKWASLGWEQSHLGYPVTDELATPDGVGRYSHFQYGSIYWTPETGACAVFGAIREKWASLGWEQSHLGYPVTDELPTPDGVGRYTDFQHGRIQWTPAEGAWVVQLTVIPWERPWGELIGDVVAIVPPDIGRLEIGEPGVDVFPPFRVRDLPARWGMNVELELVVDLAMAISSFGDRQGEVFFVCPNGRHLGMTVLSWRLDHIEAKLPTRNEAESTCGALGTAVQIAVRKWRQSERDEGRANLLMEDDLPPPTGCPIFSFPATAHFGGDLTLTRVVPRDIVRPGFGSRERRASVMLTRPGHDPHTLVIREWNDDRVIAHLPQAGRGVDVDTPYGVTVRLASGQDCVGTGMVIFRQLVDPESVLSEAVQLTGWQPRDQCTTANRVSRRPLHPCIGFSLGRDARPPQSSRCPGRSH